MIVAVYLSPGWYGDSFFMRDVKTREEAFFEMRRYCLVNGITGTETEVEENRTDDKGRRYCQVCMDGARFRIFYSGEPEQMQLKPLEEYPEQWRPTQSYERRYFCSHFYNQSRTVIFWYDELVAYFDDLKMRTGGGEVC